MNIPFKQRGGSVPRPWIAFAVLWIGLGLTNCVSSTPSHVEDNLPVAPVADSGELNEGACELSWSLCWMRI